MYFARGKRHFATNLGFWIGEYFQFFFNKRKRGRSFLHMFSMTSFPVLKNRDMREVAWRLTGLSQAKSTWALVRASAWGDCNSFFRIICLLNAESFIKMKKVSLNIVLSKEKSSYIIHWRFIYMQLLFWQWGNQMEIWNSSNRAAFRVTDDLWTSCLDDTFFGSSYLWLDAALNKLMFVPHLTLIP